MKYRKKPVEIEAIQWTGSKNSFDRVRQFCPEIRDGGAVWHPNAQGGDDDCNTSSWPLFIQTLEGLHTASIGDYIIKGVKGEFYPCKPEIFEMTYEKVEEGIIVSDVILSPPNNTEEI